MGNTTHRNFTGHEKLINLQICGSQVKKKNNTLTTCDLHHTKKKHTVEMPCCHASSDATQPSNPRPRLCMKGMDTSLPILTGRLKSVQLLNKSGVKQLRAGGFYPSKK